MGVVVLCQTLMLGAATVGPFTSPLGLRAGSKNRKSVTSPQHYTQRPQLGLVTHRNCSPSL